MNIHINKEKFDYIINNADIVGKFIIGSHLYGLNDENSDKDYLIIYHPFINQLVSPFANHHQYQYKDIENNIDYNLVDIITFIKNLVSGDSVINYELLHSTDFKNSSLGWLSDYIKDFRTYNICKSYLGMAKRDLKHLHKRKTEQDKERGILHIYRAYHSSVDIFNGEFDIHRTCLDAFDNYKNYPLEDITEFNFILEDFRKNILNIAFEEKEIERCLKNDIQEEIESKLCHYIKFTDKTLDLKDVYDTNNNVELKY